MQKSCEVCGEPMKQVAVSTSMTITGRAVKPQIEHHPTWRCTNENCPTNLVGLAPASPNQPSA